MKLYDTIPPVPLCDTSKDFIFKCREIVEWAEDNLPIARRALTIQLQNEMTENEKLAIQVAYLAHAYVRQLNISIAYYENQPLIVKIP